jgi:hypothetical protein|tara:strand:- start:877 stop:1161 length:285 start_codon:yes stop_codon:yes gene_type:complete
MTSHYDFEKRERKKQDAKSKVDQRIDDLRHILESEHGRRYLKGVLTFLNINVPISGTNNVEIYKAIGRNQAGHRIKDEILQANQEQAIKMFLNI